MLVQLTGLDPIWTLFTVIGILTLFGKKKKDEKEDGQNGEASTTMASSRSGDFAYSSKPFTIERSQLVSTAKNLVCSSAGR